MNVPFARSTTLLLCSIVCLSVLTGCRTAVCHQSSRAKDHVSTVAFTTNRMSGMDVLVVHPTTGVVMTPAPLLLLHEVTGASPETLDFAGRLADAGFVVYLPRFFGGVNEPDKSPTPRLLGLFLRPSWSVLAAHCTPAQYRVVPKLIREIHAAHPQRELGVIGMCLTGAWPLAAAQEPSVKVAVLCHPTNPLLACTDARRRALGLSKADMERAFARIRAESLTVLAFRFSEDWKSTPERFWAVRDGMAGSGRFLDATIYAAEYEPDLPVDAHSVFTGQFTRPNGIPFASTQHRFNILTNELHRALLHTNQAAP